MPNEQINSEDLRFLQFRTRQINGWEEEAIARSFDLPTPKALYAQFAEEGYPVCRSCGAHTKNHSCREMREDRAPKRERRAKATGDGNIVKLPPARAAGPIFEDMINPIDLYAKPHVEDPDDPRYHHLRWKMMGDTLKKHLFHLEYLEEELHGGNRFISTSIEEDFDDDTGPYAAFLPGGGHPYPNRRLVVLIATYALLYEKVGPLIKLLHPDPASIDQDSLNKMDRAVKNLLTEARKVATWVRGGVVKQSPPTADISITEQQHAWEIARLSDEGFSEEEICREMHGLWPAEVKRSSALNEVKRLGALNVRRPDSSSSP